LTRSANAFNNNLGRYLKNFTHIEGLKQRGEYKKKPKLEESHHLLEKVVRTGLPGKRKNATTVDERKRGGPIRTELGSPMKGRNEGWLKPSQGTKKAELLGKEL